MNPILIIGLLAALTIGLAALFRIARREEVAINAAVAEPPAPPDPALAAGLPAGISSTAVAARKQAMIAAGTPAIYAEKFAIDAEHQQAWHDADPKKRQGHFVQAGTPAEREAQAILDAQQLEKSKLTPPSEKKLEERSEVVGQAAQAAAETAGTAQPKEATA